MPMGRIAVLICATAGALAAQSGTTPKASANLYAAHAEADGQAFGAEYLMHTYGIGRDQFFVKNYLVVEAAFYPAKGVPAELRSGDFTLRLNGKQVLKSESSYFVAQVLNYPAWERERGVSVQGGIPGIGIDTGRQRLPGSRDDPPFPEPPGAPDDIPGAKAEKRLTAPEAAVEWAFPEGRTNGPVSGFLYFLYRGKASKIKTLELIFQRDERQVVVKLF